MTASSALVRRQSGLVVTADLATEPERGVPQRGAPVCYDGDGRRRIVISDELRRKQDRLVAEMKGTGQAIFLACREDFRRSDGKPSCGEVMVPEGQETDDPGYGCKCTRIHFEFRGRR